MKVFNWLFLLFNILLTSCSDQLITTNPTSIPPTQTTSFLDFDHPRLHEIAGNKPLVIDEVVRISSQGAAFVAVIVETGDPTLKHQMLMFRVKDNISTLIYDLGTYVNMTFNIEHENHPSWLLDEIPPIGIPVLVSNGGNCYDCGHIVLIGITQDGEAKDVTPITDFVPKGFVYLTGSEKAGRIELVGTRYYEFDYGAKSHVSSPYAFRLYAWDGKVYLDVSESEKEFFDGKTAELINTIQQTYGKPLNSDRVMPLLSQILFNYESSGRVDYGWEQIKILGDLSHWDVENTQPEEIQIYLEVFDLLEQRKNKDKSTPTP